MTKSLSQRMKEYEQTTCPPLPNNTPIILRVDGRAFHTFTKRFMKPFDWEFIGMMDAAGEALCDSIMNAKIAYIQSDEISVLIYGGIFSDNWFGNNVQKMCAVAASYASTCLTVAMAKGYPDDEHVPVITFDARVFAIPEKEVCNYFIWRQRDCERNSLQMVAQSMYSQKQLHGKNTQDMHDMIYEQGVNWNDFETRLKRGRCIVREEFEQDGVLRSRWKVDNEIPIFTKEREYIEKYITEVNENAESRIQQSARTQEVAKSDDGTG